jgi:hypothetical protein
VLCQDVIPKFSGAEGNGKLKDIVGIGTSRRANPIPCIGHCRLFSDSGGILPQSCVIDGKRIYYVPGGKWHDRARISVEKGERFFCYDTEPLYIRVRPELFRCLAA